MTAKFSESSHLRKCLRQDWLALSHSPVFERCQKILERLPQEGEPQEQAWLISAAQSILEDLQRDEGSLDRGAFPTPRDIASRLAELAYEQARGPVQRVLDPAAGAGALLIAARQAAQRLGLPTPELWAWECADLPLLCARRVAAVLSPEPFIVERRDLLKVSEPGEFDLVLGNPPWLSFSGRHRRRGAVPASPDRWPSSLGPFLLKMASQVREGGVLAVLVPTAYIEMPGYAESRAQLEARFGPPVRAELFSERSFRGVLCPVAALIFQSLAAREKSWQPRRSRRFVEALAGHPRFPAACFSDLGVHTGNVATRLLAPLGEGAALREGREIAAFALGPARRALRLNPELPPQARWRAASLERYQSVPILLRQTAARPIAARHRDPGYFRNSVLAATPPEGMSVELMLGLLNSDLLARFHGELSLESQQRTFPQVKIRHLRQLPMPRPEALQPELVGALEQIVREREARAGEPDDVRGELAAKIEELVALLYELPELLRESLGGTKTVLGEP